MANKVVSFLYDKYRLRALETALAENDSSIELALKNTLDSLYRKFVPQQERAEIESKIQREEADRQAKLQNTVGVFHLHNDDGDINLSSRYVKSMYKFASLYNEYIQFDVRSATIDSIADYFGEHRNIDPQLFSMVCNTFQSSDSVRIIADIDFERGNICVLSKGMGDWKTYSLDDLCSAVRSAESQPDLSEFEKKEYFDMLLAGVEQENAAESPSDDESTGIQM